jgi:hypothetical protein
MKADDKTLRVGLVSALNSQPSVLDNPPRCDRLMALSSRVAPPHLFALRLQPKLDQPAGPLSFGA